MPYHQLPTVHQQIYKPLMSFFQLPLSSADSKALSNHQDVYTCTIQNRDSRSSVQKNATGTLLIVAATEKELGLTIDNMG